MSGRIEVICGSMFSGKTEELINRIKNSGKSYKGFKPQTDTRNKKNKIESHNKLKIEATTIKNITDILKVKTRYEIIGIDEAQFFSDKIIEVCNLLANQGIRVIIAGLDMDYSGKPFGPMPFLMAIAEQVTKVHATCDETGEPALYSYRKIENFETIMIVEKKEYMPLSRKAYISKIRKK